MRDIMRKPRTCRGASCENAKQAQNTIAHQTNFWTKMWAFESSVSLCSCCWRAASCCHSCRNAATLWLQRYGCQRTRRNVSTYFDKAVQQIRAVFDVHIHVREELAQADEDLVEVQQNVASRNLVRHTRNRGICRFHVAIVQKQSRIGRRFISGREKEGQTGREAYGEREMRPRAKRRRCC